MTLDPTTGTIISSCVCVVAVAVGNAIGSAINNRRTNALRLQLVAMSGELRLGFEQAVSPLRERVAVIEARLHTLGKGET